MKLKKSKLLILSILISHLAGIVGSVATTPAIPTWYAGLNKPAFNPPNWLFGPVWLTLYTLMGIALYLVLSRGLDEKEVRFSAKVFLGQLVVNSLWSIIFFGLKNLSLAFLTIVVLWLMIAYIIKLFLKIDKRACWLLVPYLLWVSFAALLNYSIWRLN